MIEREKTVMLFVVKDGQVLLLKRINTWYGENQFAPPGGLLDEGENPITTAVREVFEETGITVLEEDIKLIKKTESEENNRFFESYYYITNKYSGDLLNKEPDRHSHLDWYPLTDLPTDTMPIIKDILLEI